MRVLQINAVYGHGSTGSMVKQLHEYLKQNNIESYVACSQGCSDLESSEFAIGTANDVKIHSVMARISGLQGYYSNKATKKLLRFMDEIKPDIVHLGNLHSNYLNVINLLNYLGDRNIATVITLHDCWFYTGKCTHYTKAGCYKWKESCGDCPQLKKDIPTWFFDRTNKMLADKAASYKKIKKLAVIGVSQWITNEVYNSVLKNASIIKTIYNWVDLEVFRPKKMEADQCRKKMGLQGKFVILGVSSIWSDLKGLSTFHALSQLLKDDEIIILVGRLNEQKLPSNIIHIPETQSVDELATYYSMADVFLQLSPEESFGKVVVEAMACGTPAISIDSTANAELIGMGTGFVSCNSNVDEIYHYIDIIKKIGSNKYANTCREYAEKNFMITKQLNKYLDIYYSLLNS